MAKADLSTSGKPRAWQRMLSGRRLDLLDPSPLDVEINDIAHGLARVARWNGQTYGEHAYSVAQHSLLVEQIFGQLHPSATPKERLMALLHDAAEYVIGDIISPFKAVMGGKYIEIEERLQQAIHLRFSLPVAIDGKMRRLIKVADQITAYYEAKTLAGFSEAEAQHYFALPHPINVRKEELVPLPTPQIEEKFLLRFNNLDQYR